MQTHLIADTLTTNLVDSIATTSALKFLVASMHLTVGSWVTLHHQLILVIGHMHQ